MIRLTTLGCLDLTDPGGRTEDSILTRPKRLALLAYLATADGASRSRDTLIGMFWAETTQTKARNALNQSLHVLRRSLGRKVLQSVGNDRVGIADGELWCDAIAFREAFDDGRFAEALALYGGEFMPGFYLSGAPEFEKWLDLQRGTMQRMASSAALRHAEACAARGEMVAAAEAAAKSAELASHDEACVRRAITLLDSIGDRARALQLYRRLEAAMVDELGAAPSAETQQLIEQIRARQEPGSLPAPAESEWAKESRRPASAPAPASPPPAKPAQPAARVDGGAAPAPPRDYGLGPVAPVDSERRRRRWAVAMLAVLVTVIATTIALTHSDGPPGRVARTHLAGGPPRVVIHALTSDSATTVADALTAALSGGLAAVEGLDVVQESAATADTALSPEERVARLSSFVVSGKVIAGAGRLRTAIEIVDGGTGRVIRAGTIEPEVTETLEYVDSVAPHVIAFIRKAIGQELREREWRAGTDDPRARDLVARAELDRIEGVEQRDREAYDAAQVSFAKADSLLALAEAEDPTWAAPSALRAEVARDAMRIWIRPARPPGAPAFDAIRRGIEHANRALQRDPAEPMAFEMRGELEFWEAVLGEPGERSRSALEASVADLRRAVEMDPKRHRAWSTLSTVLFMQGSFDEAYYAVRKAAAADTYLDEPANVLALMFLMAFEAGDDAEARAVCDETRRRYPSSPSAIRCAFQILAYVDHDGHNTYDLRAVLQEIDSSGLQPRGKAQLMMLAAPAFAARGMPDSARALARRGRAALTGDPELLRLDAAARLAVGQTDSARVLLARYVGDNPLRVGAGRSRRFVALRQDGRVEVREPAD